MVASLSHAVDTSCFVDCHCHLIPGVDDGPAGGEESLEMAAVLGSFGFSRIYCTPHFIKGAYENHPERLQEEVLRLQEMLDGHDIPIEIRPGAEYYLDEYLQAILDRPLTLWNNVILLEAHRYVHPRLLAESAYHIITASKLRPLIAHPERYEFLAVPKAHSKSSGFLSFLRRSSAPMEQNPEGGRFNDDDSDVVVKLREMGCLLQGNIGSFAGIYGGHIRKRSIELLQRGQYDLIGTDAHRAHGLAKWLKTGLEVIEQEVGREGLARLLHIPGENKGA